MARADNQLIRGLGTAQGSGTCFRINNHLIFSLSLGLGRWEAEGLPLWVLLSLESDKFKVLIREVLYLSLLVASDLRLSNRLIVSPAQTALGLDPQLGANNQLIAVPKSHTWAGLRSQCCVGPEPTIGPGPRPTDSHLSISWYRQSLGLCVAWQEV